MNDMTPPTFWLTAKNAKSMLEAAGATKVAVFGRGIKMLAFFEFKRRRQAWVIHGDAVEWNFANDIAREFA